MLDLSVIIFKIYFAFNYVYFVCVCMYVRACVYTCVHLSTNLLGSQKAVLDPLELEL